MPDAEGAVGGLVFDRRIPPTVELDDMTGGGEGETGTAGFDGDSEKGLAAADWILNS